MSRATLASRRRSAARRREAAGLAADFRGAYDEAYRWVAVYDSEARAAIARHPDAEDLFHHAAGLLARPHWLPDDEDIYRGYVAELAERLATGADTRPGTACEVALALARYTVTVKASATIKGLYHRMWVQAFPGHPETETAAAVLAWDDRDDGTGIAELEAEMRRRLRQPRRKLPADLTCDGWHGPCRFAGPR